MLPNQLHIERLHELREWLSGHIVRTPTMECPQIGFKLGSNARVHAKLEFLQRTGTFKARGALATLRSLTDEQLARGVTAVSAGNHAIAVAYAASVFPTNAKLVMLRTANPARVERVRQYGAEIVFADGIHAAFEEADRIRDDEGRVLVHPFEGPGVSAGTGTLGLEICEQVDDIDAVVVPIGGGGLCSGVAAAVKQRSPETLIIGVEPAGADSMRRSLAAGEPVKLDSVDTIADSLAAPYAMPFSFSICKQLVDEVVLVSDAEIRAAMKLLFEEMKIVTEPACAASTAALLGPLADKLGNSNTVLIMCGSNIDWQTFERLVYQ